MASYELMSPPTLNNLATKKITEMENASKASIHLRNLRHLRESYIRVII